MASGSHVADAGDPEAAPIGSSPTKATVIRAVAASCASGRSSIRSPSGATNARNGRRDRVVRWPSTRRPMLDATWSSAVSIGSNSGAGRPLGTRNAPSTIGRCSSWPRSSSGLTNGSGVMPVARRQLSAAFAQPSHLLSDQRWRGRGQDLSPLRLKYPLPTYSSRGAPSLAPSLDGQERPAYDGMRHVTRDDASAANG
jgi:hypothetical protein